MDFAADCNRCAALCCRAFAFVPGDDFADAKGEGEDCRHLVERGCSIHAERAARGYAGCIDYECLGAGPAATLLFPPARAGEAVAVRRARLVAFRILGVVHAIGAALQRAQMPAEQAEAIRAMLEPEGGWSYSALLDFDRSDARSRLLGQIAGAIHNSKKGDFIPLTGLGVVPITRPSLKTAAPQGSKD